MKRFFRKLIPALLLMAPLAAAAQIVLLPECTKTGDCGITDMLAVFLNVAEYLLGISGAVALGFFVYGGFKYILSRGDSGKVKEATGVLTSAVVGIVIIFLSGVLVRFTTQALTGGQSQIPTVGETCSSKSQKSAEGGDGLWVTIPTGLDADGKRIPEGLVCIAKDNCGSLNAELKRRNLSGSYACLPVQTSSSCVRGLCPSKGADFACCLSTKP